MKTTIKNIFLHIGIALGVFTSIGLTYATINKVSEDDLLSADTLNAMIAGINHFGFSNGKVGIGTDNPSQSLSVVGKISLGEKIQAQNRFMLSTGPGGAIFNQNDNSPIYFQTQSNTQMTIRHNGNVGIGTTNPRSKLSVVGLSKGINAIEAGMLGTVDGAVCIMSSGDIYIDTDGVCN